MAPGSHSYLKDFYLVPSVFLHSLCDTHLQSPDLTLGIFPIDGLPFFGVIGRRTRHFGYLLLSYL